MIELPVSRIPAPQAANFENEAATPQVTFSGVKHSKFSKSLPRRMLLGTLSDGRFKVIVPARIYLSEEGEFTIAEAKRFNEFGFGKNASEAIRELQRAVVELYLALERDQMRLGSDLRRVWEKLQKSIRKR